MRHDGPVFSAPQWRPIARLAANAIRRVHDVRRPWNSWLLHGRDRLLESLDLSRGNPHENANPKALELTVFDELADHAVGAAPSVGKLRDRIGPDIMLGQNVARARHGRLFLG
jgi:hypothetical protein